MIFTSSIAYMLSLVIVLSGGFINPEFVAFHKDFITTKQFQLKGTAELTYDMNVLEQMNIDIENIEYPDNTQEPVKLAADKASVLQKITTSYDIKADVRDKMSPEVDMTIGLGLSNIQGVSDIKGNSNIKGNFRLVVDNKSVYTDIATLKSICTLVYQFGIGGGDVAEKDVNNLFDEILSKESINLIKLTTLDDINYTAAVSEINNKKQEEILTEAATLSQRLLKGYENKLIVKTGTGYHTRVDIENVLSESESIYTAYKANRNNEMENMYNLFIKIYNMQEDMQKEQWIPYTDKNGKTIEYTVEAPLTYEEFVDELDKAQIELDKTFTILKSGTTEKDDTENAIALNILKNGKGTFMDYSINKKDKTYSINFTTNGAYKGRTAAKVISKFEYTPTNTEISIGDQKSITIDELSTRIEYITTSNSSK